MVMRFWGVTHFRFDILILETKELIRILPVCIRTKYNQDFTVFSLYEPHQIVISPFKIIIEKTKLTKKKKTLRKTSYIQRKNTRSEATKQGIDFHFLPTTSDLPPYKNKMEKLKVQTLWSETNLRRASWVLTINKINYVELYENSHERNEKLRLNEVL